MTRLLRKLVVYALGALGLFLSEPAFPWVLAGGALALTGLSLRLWACGYLEKNQRLVTGGPYAHVQHPLYLGSLLIALGFLLFTGSPGSRGRWVWLVLAPLVLAAYFFVYMPRKSSTEGERLVRRFGEAATRWLREVPRYVPRLRAYSERESTTWQASRLRANHEIAVTLGVILLFAAGYARHQFL